MFPVSGAPQLKISGNMIDLPMVSHNEAYSKFDKPDTEGKKRFHSPYFWAFSFSSSIIFGVVVHLNFSSLEI